MCVNHGKGDYRLDENLYKVCHYHEVRKTYNEFALNICHLIIFLADIRKTNHFGFFVLFLLHLLQTVNTPHTVI